MLFLQSNIFQKNGSATPEVFGICSFFLFLLAFNVPDLEKKPTVDVFRPPIGALAKVKFCMKDYFFD